MERKREKVFAAMSGGVDSSVAALLLKENGYEVVGCHMICWEGCDSNEDKRDAMRVCAKLDIPFLTFDFRREYREKVFDYMIQEYAAGRTPNPDVMCNKYIKFGIFLEKALEMGTDYIATGHYVRKSEARNPKSETNPELLNTKYQILEARDSAKDQSYFLWTLTQEKLKYCLFPVGNYLKSEVREMAREAGLPTAEKKDSQGLCFVGKVNFHDFLRSYLPRKDGNVINPEGKILGQHDGAYFFTPGQRHGIKIGGNHAPFYVAETDRQANSVLVAQGPEDPVLYKKEIQVFNLNTHQELPEKFSARIRYRQPLQEAGIMNYESGKLVVRFEKPQRGVAPGQSIVFYDGDRFLGGGIIEN